MDQPFILKYLCDNYSTTLLSATYLSQKKSFEIINDLTFCNNRYALNPVAIVMVLGKEIKFLLAMNH
jgi:hypothetical protein